ncbi:unnamed protein product [Bursaphelenchus xylophilus]|uniref:(pine wood nematode) hypothetical protein n=1 Tax=Bursaphelenchus xylophilus TaxID=6326 RepID=A0A7I8X6A7_BURXY|nr:unnamed protein product [Bursaphelenchus xylophilus]CAG9123208.1 unnamed protein product [Bursaphelenchus xylophilus]
MPVQKGQFVDAVKPALEGLLTDLQRTTEVLRRHNRKSKDYDDKWESTSSQFSYRAKRTSGVENGDLDRSLRGQSTGRDSTYRDSLRESGRDSTRLDSSLDQTLPADFQTIPRGDCGQCGQAIVGEVIIALGQMWHPEHFTCYQCGDQIGHKLFFEKDEKAYCEDDYHENFSPRCGYCQLPVKERAISALGKTYHQEHFTCAQCGKALDSEGYHEKDGYAYCNEDFYQTYAPKCKGCEKPITAKFITALDTHWHPECFVCDVCSESLFESTFHQDGVTFLCRTHYLLKYGNVCYQCQEPIAGKCVTALGRKYHLDHFCCCYCNKMLCSGTFKHLHGRLYCSPCFDRVVV